MFGHDISRIVDKDIDEYLCGICLNVVNQPMSVYCCRKINCTSCLEQWLKNHESCPNCREYLNKDGLIIVPRLVNTRLNQIRIKCERYTDGCPAVVTIADINKHMDVCQYANCSICNSKDIGDDHKCLPHLLKTINKLKAENNRLRLSNECLLDSICDLTRKEVTINFTVQNFRRLKKKIASPVSYMSCLPWRMVIEPSYTEDDHGQTIKSVGFYVECRSSASDTYFDVSMDLMILSQKDGVDDLKKTFRRVFEAPRLLSHGTDTFAKWNLICNPANGYISDGKVMFAVTITKVEEEEHNEDSDDSESDDKVETVSKAVQTDSDEVVMVSIAIQTDDSDSGIQEEESNTTEDDPNIKPGINVMADDLAATIQYIDDPWSEPNRCADDGWD